MKNLFRSYKDYLEDNPKGYWFKAKMFGWGWTPVTWQGWVVTLIYVAVLVLLGLAVDEDAPKSEFALFFLLPVIILTSLFIRIAYKKGEKPGLRWGEKREDKNK